MEQTLRIEQLGRHGEGMARHGNARVFVPYALAGETVRVEIAGERGRLIEIVEPAAERAEPFCPHFGVCGGCALQHMTPDAYAAWKRDIVATALANRDIDEAVAPLIDAHGAGRRRATLHAMPTRTGVVAGFTAARSHRIVALDACPILVPELAAAPTLAADLVAASRSDRKLDILLTATDSGIDAHIAGLWSVGLAARQALSEAAAVHDLARITLNDETIVERRPPRVRMGDALVTLPPRAFLQATPAGEAALAAGVTAHLAGAGRVVDLFSGLGPFALRLAHESRVLAVDNDAAALQALVRAARGTAGLKPVETETRNLFTRPLRVDELARFDAAVFDPPRAGAEAQARLLAASRIPRIAAVSCDPATFARDVGILVKNGYTLLTVQPVDQFKWSPHVEVLGLLERR